MATRHFERVYAARRRLIDLVFPPGHQIDGATACEIRDAIDTLEKTNYAQGRAGDETGEPAPPVGPDELREVLACVERRSAEFDQGYRARLRPHCPPCYCQECARADRHAERSTERR